MGIGGTRSVQEFYDKFNDEGIGKFNAFCDSLNEDNIDDDKYTHNNTDDVRIEINIGHLTK